MYIVRYSLNSTSCTYKYRLYAEAKGSTGFIIPEDFMTSEGIINTIDPNG